jgi:hypothetical protein
MTKCIIAHDVGTSGNKAVLVDTEGHVHGKCFEPYRTYYPSPGCVEQEPADWWRAVSKTTRLLLERTGVSPGDVLCITYAAQLLGIVPMDSESGPLRRAIIWMDCRAGEQAERLMRKFLSFFLISALPIMLTMSAEITGARFAGISVGYLQLLGNTAAVAIVPIMESMRNTTGQFIWPLAFIAGLLGIAFILAIVIREPARGPKG